jgi:hypothetical protein
MSELTPISPARADGYLGQNVLKGRQGDQFNAVMSAVG